MGKILVLLISLILVAVASLFFLKGQDNQPLISVSDLKKPDMGISGVIERIPEVKNPLVDEPLPAPGDIVQPPGKTRIYSWRDEEGNVHFSNQPADSDRQTEQILVDPDINVVPAIKMPEQQ